MRIEGLIFPNFEDPELLALSENPDPTYENGMLFVSVKSKNGKRYRVTVSGLVKRQEGSKRLFERSMYAAGQFFQDSGLSKKEALTTFHNAVFSDWEYGKKKK